MTKCDFCRYGKMQNGKFECTANCWAQQIYACEEAIKKMMEYAELEARANTKETEKTGINYGYCQLYDCESIRLLKNE